MAHEKIPYPKSGIAGFSTTSFTGPAEPLYSGDVKLTTDHVQVTNSGGAALTLPQYSVVSYDPATKAMALDVAGGSAAYSVLPADVVVPAGATITVPIYREGYFDMDALNWDASYDTFDKKKFAFEGGVNKIFIGDKGPKGDNIIV